MEKQPQPLDKKTFNRLCKRLEKAMPRGYGQIVVAIPPTGAGIEVQTNINSRAAIIGVLRHVADALERSFEPADETNQAEPRPKRSILRKVDDEIEAQPTPSMPPLKH